MVVGEVVVRDQEARAALSPAVTLRASFERTDAMLSSLPTALVTSLILLAAPASAAFDCQLALGSDKFDLTPVRHRPPCAELPR